MFPTSSTFAQVLLQHEHQSPDRVALVLLHNRLPDQTIRFGELLEGAIGYAQALTNAGIRPGEVVILVLDHGEELIYAFIGAILAGAVPSIMPFLTEKLDPEHYRVSLSALFQITRPAVVVAEAGFLTQVQLAQGTSPHPRRILTPIDRTVSASFNRDDLPGLKSQPDDIVLLQHSSGTTGLQKGVALSHRAVFNQLNAYAPAIRLAQDDVIVSWLPLYHDMGLIAGFLMPILCGVPLILMSPFDWVRAPQRLLQAISDYRGTLSWLPNFAYNFCAQKIRQRDLEGVDLSSWRAVINCSEPMHWKSHEEFIERFAPYGLRPESLGTCYAMAENVFAVTQGGIDSPVHVDLIDRYSLLIRQVAEPSEDGELSTKMLSAGKALPGASVRVTDEKGNQVPERVIGEIAILSDCMLSGYYNRPDLTEAAFQDGWYLTGDLGYQADGELYITGRKKDLIIVGGKNIYPQDLERLAGEVPGVHPGRVVSFGVFNERIGTEEVVIVAELDEEDPVARQAIADDVRTRVTRGSDIALRYVHAVDRGWLLKTSSGKIARGANRQKFLEETG
jgi:acyl-CoA synthetase (AMP-forming)/AMP-acid ligase II